MEPEIEEYQEVLDELNYIFTTKVLTSKDYEAIVDKNFEDIKLDKNFYKTYLKNVRVLQELIDLRNPKEVKKYSIPTSPVHDKTVGLCLNCGKDEIEEGSNFCPNCGQRLKW